MSTARIDLRAELRHRVRRLPWIPERRRCGRPGVCLPQRSDTVQRHRRSRRGRPGHRGHSERAGDRVRHLRQRRAPRDIVNDHTSFLDTDGPFSIDTLRSRPTSRMASGIAREHQLERGDADPELHLLGQQAPGMLSTDIVSGLSLAGRISPISASVLAPGGLSNEQKSEHHQHRPPPYEGQTPRNSRHRSPMPIRHQLLLIAFSQHQCARQRHRPQRRPTHDCRCFGPGARYGGG